VSHASLPMLAARAPELGIHAPVELPPLAGVDLEMAGLEERRMEAWRLYSSGHTQISIAKKLGLSRATIQKYLSVEAKLRLSRLENSEEELEKIIGQLEAILGRSWKAHRDAFGAGPSSLAASNYLRLCLDSAREIARLRGFDSLVARRGDTGPSRTEIVVRIGGTEDFAPAVTVGARFIEGSDE